MEDPDPMIPFTLGRSLWAIDPETLPRLRAAHRASNLSRYLRAPEGAKAARPRAARRSSGTTGGGMVMVIPLTGIITTRMSFLSWLYGGGTLLDFREQFREALNSPEVGSIVLDIDSPGGLVDLVPEIAQEIYDARGAKPIVAVANTMCASAAYFIASQADEVVITPSGSAGSIGVYMLHEDWSKFNEEFGVDPTYVFAGAHKIDGNPDEPLGEAVKADWQQEVDDIYGWFVDAVARGRDASTDDVASGYGQGRTLLAERALAAGLVDRIDTLEAVVGDLLTPNGGASAGRASQLVPAPRAEADDPAPEEPSEKPDPAETPETEPANAAAPTREERLAFAEVA